MPLLEIADLSVDFATTQGSFRAVDNVSLALEDREVLAIVGEFGLGQVGGHARRDGSPAMDGQGLGAPRRLRRPRHPRPVAAAAAADRRQGHGDDLPGADVEPQSRASPSASRSSEALKAHLDLDREERRRRAMYLLSAVGIADRRAAPAGVSAPALRRHEPARHDRHGARLPAEAPDRRRADDGARRDHPGPDPRSPSRSSAGDRHGPRSDHP